MPTLARDWVESVLISGHNFMEWSIPIKCAMGFGFHMLVRILFLLWPPARGQLRCSPTISYIKQVPLVRTTIQYRIVSGYADSGSSISCTICWQYELRWPRQESSIRCTCLTPSIGIMPSSRRIIQLTPVYSSRFRRMVRSSPLNSIAIVKSWQMNCRIKEKCQHRRSLPYHWLHFKQHNS